MVLDELEVKLQDLEGILVKQFRMLQKLAEITKDERQSLVKDETDTILLNVEAKEAVLDQLSLIEDSRRMIMREIVIMLNLHTDSISVNDLLPNLNPSAAIPIRRLSEGISSLVVQARDLTYGNQALANSRLDWLRSLQSFLVAASFPETGYSHLSGVKRPEEPAVTGLEFRA